MKSDYSWHNVYPTFQISGIEVEVVDTFFAPSSYSGVSQADLAMETQGSHLVNIQQVSQ